MRKITFMVCCFMLLHVSHAQRFGGTPPGVKWKQINTDSARVIFPDGLDSQAQRVASLIHYQASKNPVALGGRVDKIDIVLQNETTVSNGYVGLGPYRSEFYLTPFPNNLDQGSLSWVDQLSIHEYRHVQQFNNFRNGISNVMRVLFGQEGYALAINASIPDWFFEGDAVYNETVLSEQGRGRLPLFMNAYPALWKAGKRYTWMKLRNGSLKDYVPDHYELGYPLVNYGYEKYGPDFWRKVTQDASRFKGLFYPFQRAIKTHAGVSYKAFRQEAFAHFKQQDEVRQARLQKQTPNGGDAGVTNLFPVNKSFVTNRVFAYQAEDNKLVYLKTSYRKRPAFFIKDETGEHRLRARDISLEDQFSYRNGLIVYASYQNDPRWRWRDYSVINILDVATKKQRTITSRSKYFSPDISASGTKVAAVEVAPDGKSELHILNANTGEVEKRISSNEINLYTDPKFINEDSIVTPVRLKDGKMTLAIIDLKAGNTARLTPPSFNVIGFPSVSGTSVYFTATYGGNDDIFMLTLGDNKIYRVTKSSLGNYFVNAPLPQDPNGKITWSTFTAEGYQLQQMNVKAAMLEPIRDTVEEKLVGAFPVANAASIKTILGDPATNRVFPVKNYSKGTRLLNFHSWRPYYEDPEFTFSLYGENVLNTLQTEIYYLYNENERSNAAGVSATFGGWFPYLSIGSQMTFAREDSDSNFLRQWNQLDSRVGINIPLSFTRGRMSNALNIGTNFFLRNEFNSVKSRNWSGTNDFTYLHHFVNWSQQIETARQHIYPRFAYSISFNHRYAVTKIDGYQFLPSASLYLPGLFSTHSIVITGAAQWRDTSLALFSSGIANARGHSDYYRTNIGSKMWRIGTNYHFPLLHPDWGFGNILYLMRLRGNLFYDYQRMFTNTKDMKFDLRSTGVEFYVDTKWWNQYELTFGFRISRLLDADLYTRKKATIYEFILPVSIFPR
jgi:hypothetical protein